MTFLNVDLEVVSRSSLEPLVKALGVRVFVLHHARENKLHRFACELSSQRYAADPEGSVRALLRLVRRLPVDAARAWRRAQVRTLDVGVEQGFRATFGARTLARVADVGAALAVTVYPRDTLAGRAPPLAHASALGVARDGIDVGEEAPRRSAGRTPGHLARSPR